MRVWIFVLVVVLALVLVWARRRAARARQTRARAARAGGEPPPKKELPFPWRAPFLPSPTAMFYNLANAKLRTRKAPGFDKVIVRDETDLRMADLIADHYVEPLRVRAALPGREPPWDMWKRVHVRDRALRAVRGGCTEGACLAFALRAALDANEPPDTNPAFAMYLVRRLARRQKRAVSDVRVVDVGVGWGGQLLGACAADVGAYQGYIPYVTRGSKKALKSLSAALAMHRPSGTKTHDFWLRQMEIDQAAPEQTYDIAFANVSDLTSLAGGATSALCRSVRPGGHVVLFVPPGKQRSARALAGIDLMARGGMGLPAWTYGARTPAGGPGERTEKAFVWKI